MATAEDDILEGTKPKRAALNPHRTHLHLVPEPSQKAIAAAAKARTYNFTDLGNAELLVALFHRDIRYVHGIGWLVWDGRRWSVDDTSEVMRIAKQVARARFVLAIDMEPGTKARAAALQFAWNSESRPRLEAMISLAESERPLVLRANELNRDPWVLNVNNGTIDLKTNELRPHNRADLITKLAPVDFDPGARSDLWDSFLETATEGDVELQRYLAALAGYSASGCADQKIFAFIQGVRDTGKTTFYKAVQNVLGDYAENAEFRTFLASKSDRIRNDLAKLAGVRAVFASEPESGQAFAGNFMKLITGGDKVTARFLYREEFTYEVQFTIWLVGNDKPAARATDDAFWRRAKMIPFSHVIQEADQKPEVQNKLWTDPATQSAILAWIVRGCTDWQGQGLKTPQCVLDRTAEWRAENDALTGWLEEKCELRKTTWTAAKALRDSYVEWCLRNDVDPGNAREEWRAALITHGCYAKKRNGVRGWYGIRLATPGQTK
jgi:putative DNA primase/helicase